MNIQKHTSATVINDGSKRILEQFINLKSRNEDFDRILENHLPEFTTILIEDPTATHCVYEAPEILPGTS